MEQSWKNGGSSGRGWLSVIFALLIILFSLPRISSPLCHQEDALQNVRKQTAPVLHEFTHPPTPTTVNADPMVTCGQPDASPKIEYETFPTGAVRLLWRCA